MLVFCRGLLANLNYYCSLGKIVASPRYGQYPDLSDDDDQVTSGQYHLSLPPESGDPGDPPVPCLRQVALSAPPVRVLQPVSSATTKLQNR